MLWSASSISAVSAGAHNASRASRQTGNPYENCIEEDPDWSGPSHQADFIGSSQHRGISTVSSRLLLWETTILALRKAYRPGGGSWLLVIGDDHRRDLLTEMGGNFPKIPS
jgi:hypothetical protein